MDINLYSIGKGEHTMSSNTVLFGWNRPIPGRERMSETHFDDFVKYCTELQQSKTIQSFDIVFLNPHGGDLNGFFLLRGESTSLDNMVSSKEWVNHMTRATMHLEGAGFVRGQTGDMVMEMMNIWKDNIPG
jgi:hypothetical protein